MLHTLVVYVEDKPGVLNRVASLFRRRAFNIDSLTVGHTETPDVSRMTIVFQVEQEDSVYPMVPAGADLHAMIRRPSPIVETAADA